MKIEFTTKLLCGNRNSEKHNAFHLIPAESSNTIYLNDEPIYVPVKLNARDIIEFGECKLMFVSFCDDSFSWKSNGDK